MKHLLAVSQNVCINCGLTEEQIVDQARINCNRKLIKRRQYFRMMSRRRPPAVGVGVKLPVRIFSLHDPGHAYDARKYLEDWASNLGASPPRFVRLNRAIWPKKLK